MKRMTSYKNINKKKENSTFVKYKNRTTKTESIDLLKCKIKSCDVQLKITEPIQEDEEEKNVNPKRKIYCSNQHNHKGEKEQDPKSNEDESRNYVILFESFKKKIILTFIHQFQFKRMI